MHRLAAKPIKARVEFAMDTPRFRDRGEAQSRASSRARFVQGVTVRIRI
jgi:hypothetical protein